MDILFPNASLIDGTGSPSRRADVAVTGDRITEVAEPGSLVPEANTDVIDLGDLTLAPGFIDIHTHYDAQILWDGDLTPSSWHGVTTVVMGNCGFAVAPTRPEHRETIVRERGGHVDGGAQRGHRLGFRDLPRIPGRDR
jgi:N-acyl-D-aspartate/D-glutamate deacylase